MVSMERPIWSIPRISRAALGACVVVHALAIAAVPIVWPWTPLLGAAVVAITAAGGLLGWELTAVPRSFVAVLLTSDQQWILTDAAGQRHAARVRGTVVVTSLFLLVPLETEGVRHTWLVTPDTTPPDTLRRLRLRLRFAPAARATAS